MINLNIYMATIQVLEYMHATVHATCSNILWNTGSKDTSTVRSTRTVLRPCIVGNYAILYRVQYTLTRALSRVTGVYSTVSLILILW
jgi:hypothetical protein